MGEIWVGDRNTSVVGVKTVVEFMRFDVTHRLEHFGFFPVERIKKRAGERIMDGVETSFRGVRRERRAYSRQHSILQKVWSLTEQILN